MKSDPDPIYAVQTCTACGSFYSPLENSGGCLGCAARFALAIDDETGDCPLEDSLQGIAKLRRYGHFEIAVSDLGEPIELGHGAMGTTYRGWDTVLHTPVALKVINISVADHPEARTRFIREARAAAQLRHPNIASVFHYGEQDGDCFYAMELVDGETLEERVLREGPLSVYLALEIVAQAAQALAAAEARGIVHRDLKPSNLMLVGKPGTQGAEETPLLKVIDFGLAKVVSELHEDRGATDTRILFVGTPAFASPEQYSKLEDVRLDTRSDIYSLGVTLWYLLSGKMPFVGSSLHELEEKQRKGLLPLNQLIRAGVPRRIIGLLKSLLAVDPCLRPQSARELLDLIREYQEKFPLLASERKRRRTRQLLIFCGLSVAIFVAAAIGFYQAQPPVIPPERSIAVLPFKNLSPDKADAFFTTAVQYGMAANLAHIPSFKVVGPESTARYTSEKLDYPTIGRKLGVRYLLEGSVLHEGDLAHVAVRLIDLDNLARPLTSQYDVPINEALTLNNQKLPVPETVHDPSSLLAFLLPIHAGGLGSLAMGVGASVPFTEYEAESGALAGGSTVITLTSPPTPDCSSPQLEASGRAFVQLAGKDQSVTWTNDTDKSFAAINLRYSIPDAPNGGGIKATLDMYVNGTFRQVLHLTSAQTWLYQASVQDNGMAQVPAPGLHPHVFFDEMHARIQGAPVAPGSTIMLKQDSSNLASFYWIDLIDLETPPAPLSKPADFLSIADFGAQPNDSHFDNTPAFRRCIAAAQSQGKGVWIPTGTFYLTVAADNLHAKGITIEGAGPWYSTIYHLVPLPSGYVSFTIFCASCTIKNLAFDSNADSSDPSRGSSTAISMGGSDWVLDNIWSQHEGLVWANAQAGTVENCRVNNAWGAGIAIFNGGPDPKPGNTLDIQNNFCRGNGYDAISIESSSFSPPYHRPRIANNTSVCSFWGANLRIGGGSDIMVENNLLRDPVTDANMVIGIAPLKDEDANLDSAIVQGNSLVRGGAFKFRSLPTASLIIGGDATQTGFQPTKVSNIDVLSNTISDPLFSGIFLGSSFNAVLQNNVISSPGTSGIVVFGDGNGIWGGNLINGCPVGQAPVSMTPGCRTLSVPIAATSYNSASPGLSYEACTEGGRDVAYIQNGSYLLYHTIDFTDVTTFVARVASNTQGGQIQLRLDNPNGPLIGTASVSSTGGWWIWRTVTCSISPTNGIHDVYLVFTGGPGNLFNLEWLSFYAEPSVTLATDYSAMNGGITTENCTEKQYELGNILNNSYTSYRNVDLGGKNIFYARVATPVFGGNIEVRMDNPNGLLLGTCVVPWTGGWQSWKTVSCALKQERGLHNLYLVYTGSGLTGLFNFEWFAFEMPPLDSIEATRMNSASPGIKIENCAEGGYDLTSFSNGSYVAYNDVNMTGLTSFTARTASCDAEGGELQVHLDSPTGPLVGACKVLITPAWQSWTNESCNLIPSNGFHNLYLVYSGDTFNLKSFQLSP